MSFTLETPWLAVFALVGVVVLAVMFRSGPRLARVFRIIALGMLVLAASGPSIGRSSPGLVVLRDVSASVGPGPAELASVPGHHLVFAGRIGETGTDLNALETEKTDIAAALQVAASFAPSRILLVSDGQFTAKDPTEALPNVPIDVLPLAPRENARVLDIAVAGIPQPGARLRAIATFETSRASPARVWASVNGQVQPSKRVNLPQGRSSVAFEFIVPEELSVSGGEIVLEVGLEVSYVQPSLDDRRKVVLGVETPPSVLCIGDPAMARLLRAQGIRVVEGGASLIHEPLNPQAIIVRGAASDFSLAQLQLLARYVEEGGGLMLSGGPKSFGLGGWSRTPVDALLPVSSDLRTRIALPLVALVLVLDRSLSMAGGSGNEQKLGLAIEGASNVVELAAEHDRIGVITFSDTPAWVFRPLRASESNKLQMLAALSAITAEGGTVLEPAYREAIAALEQTQASIKHLILLTDGQISDDPSRPGASAAAAVVSLAQAARKQNITTSSIAVGNDADLLRLRQIAEAGGGRFYAALDPATLPRIFTAEALAATRSLVRHGPIQPTLVRHPLSAGIESPVPALGAYVATTLRPTGEAILLGLDEEPILAVARRGSGRVAALTSDLNVFDAFNRWVKLPALLGAVSRWLLTALEPYRLEISPDGQHVVVDAVQDGQYVNNARFKVRVAGREVSLLQTGPGRYEASLPLLPDLQANVVLLRGSRVVAKSVLTNQNRELDTSNGKQTLERIAAASGGHLLQSLDGYAVPTKIEKTMISPWLASAALGSLLIELFIRKVGSIIFRRVSR